jgi:outer membrane receptor protein involved in Fe transport
MKSQHLRTDTAHQHTVHQLDRVVLEVHEEVGNRRRPLCKVASRAAIQNIGAQLLEGIDLDATYKLPLPKLGNASFTINGSYLLKDAITPYAGANTYDCSGLLNFASFGVYDSFNREISGYSYLDLAVAWNVYKGVQIRTGVNNLLDKDPPVVTSEITAGGAANTYETCDLLGRQVYLAVTAKF